jgi:hypothetical protein
VRGCTRVRILPTTHWASNPNPPFFTIFSKPRDFPNQAIVRQR